MSEAPAAHAPMTRHQLYELIWAEPMIKVAKRFGLSDVGLAKICRKHDVPRPPRGYWAKVQNGQKPVQIRLPRPDLQEEIEMRDAIETTNPDLRVLDEAQQLVAAEHSPEMRIQVADSLRGSHELVSQANQEFYGERVDPNGLINRLEKPTLDIAVSKSSLRRALLIMDAVLKALEKRGHEVQPGPKAKLLGVVLGFSISEWLETVREPCEEHDLEGEYKFGHSRYNEKRSPSGKLTLKINDGGVYWSHGSRHTWRDTDKKRLEDRLNHFVAGLVEMAAQLKRHHDEQRAQAEMRKQEELRRQEEARQRAIRREQYKAEKARFDLLLTQAENWRKSKLVRDLIEVARQAHSAKGPIEPGSKIAVWLEWATQQADRLDPLQVSPPSILDEELGEDEEPQRGFRRTW